MKLCKVESDRKQIKAFVSKSLELVSAFLVSRFIEMRKPSEISKAVKRREDRYEVEYLNEAGSLVLSYQDAFIQL